MEKKYTPSLWVCVLMDLLGCASYAVPMLGEVGDVIWAPLSAIIFLPDVWRYTGYFW